MTARAQKEYMDYCMITQGYYDSGKEDGIAIGKEEAKLEAARNLIIKNKLDLEDIADCIGLPLETVQQLAEELKVAAVQ